MYILYNMARSIYHVFPDSYICSKEYCHELTAWDISQIEFCTCRHMSGQSDIDVAHTVKYVEIFDNSLNACVYNSYHS